MAAVPAVPTGFGSYNYCGGSMRRGSMDPPRPRNPTSRTSRKPSCVCRDGCPLCQQASSAQFNVLFTSEEERLRLMSRMESEIMEFAAKAEQDSTHNLSGDSHHSLTMRDLEDLEKQMRADVENSMRQQTSRTTSISDSGPVLTERALTVLEDQATNIQRVVSECNSKEQIIAGLRAQCIDLSGARESAEVRAERAWIGLVWVSVACWFGWWRYLHDSEKIGCCLHSFTRSAVVADTGKSTTWVTAARGPR